MLPNKPLNNIISRNLSSIIPDHLIQFLIDPLDFSKKPSKMIDAIKKWCYKKNYWQRCYKSFFTNSSLWMTLLKLIWMVLTLLLMQMMLLSIFSKSDLNKLLDKHALFKTTKYSKTKHEWYETKPWITPRLANSIRNRHKLYKSFCKEKDPKTKEYFEKQFKSSCNLVESSFIFRRP